VIDPSVAVAPAHPRTTHVPGPIAVTSGQVFPAASELSAGTILVAEDEPRLVEAISRYLSDRYTVVVALDGTSAAELVKRHQPQLLITDVDMPGMTGI
ncbi:MAG TPA: response regulator, partial [Kofleriaceae bacterium]|nr:response regulator [Kofleriaceae bacterium]